MKLEEYLDTQFTESTGNTGRCDVLQLKGKIWCPQCPRCTYESSMPGHLVSSNCEYAYFPYCRNNHEPNCESWRTTDNCNLPVIQPSYTLFATQKQFRDMDTMHVGDLGLDACAKQAYELRSASAYFSYDTCSSEKCPCYIYTAIRDFTLQERPGNVIYRLEHREQWY